MRDGIANARFGGVPEYCFVTAAGLAAGQQDEISAAIEKAIAGMDVAILDIHEAARHWAVALNTARRPRIGEAAASILRDNLTKGYCKTFLQALPE